MPKLHEVLAVEGDLEGVAKNVIEEAKGTFGKRERFLGHTKSLKMFDAGRKHEEAAGSEHKEVTTTVDVKLKYVRNHIVRYLDAYCQKESTNQVASADLVVDGTVLLSNVPATVLLGLETKLKGIRAMYDAIPTLDPGIKWARSEQDGLYHNANPSVRHKTEKTTKFTIMDKATDKHPAQIDKWQADVAIGEITEEVVSGMISPTEKSVLMGRIDTLIQAVKKARMRANEAEVTGAAIGDVLFNYIHPKG